MKRGSSASPRRTPARGSAPLAVLERQDELKVRLDALLASSHASSALERDPVRFVHRYESSHDRELVGLLAATLAFGNVKAIGASVTEALRRLGPAPSRTIARSSEAALARRFDGFVHRVYRGPDVARMLAGAARLCRRYGSLERAFVEGFSDEENLREALARLADGLRGPNPARSLAHLVPDPRAGSACKRLVLWLRWMVRDADGIDLGLWKRVSPRSLIIPLDTHVHRIARNLGLTARNDASWRTAEEVTQALRRFDPDDPVKYDFALCHMGVSRDCPSRLDAERCGRCVMQDVCRAAQSDPATPTRSKVARVSKFRE